MSDVAIGQTVPDFELPATGEQTIKLAELRGKAVVLYFYPKDSTPGCTKEGQAFRDLHGKFKRAVLRGQLAKFTCARERLLHRHR